MLIIGFMVLNRPQPPLLKGYVTRRILDGGSIGVV
jgi:hypothetical protein